MFVVQHCIDYEMYTVPSNQKVVAQKERSSEFDLSSSYSLPKGPDKFDL